jgi:hypothetical protein
MLVRSSDGLVRNLSGLLVTVTITVTTTTVSTADTAQIANIFGLLLIVILVGFLIAKEISIGTPAWRSSHWGPALRVAIVPLTISFVIIVGVNLVNVVR